MPAAPYTPSPGQPAGRLIASTFQTPANNRTGAERPSTTGMFDRFRCSKGNQTEQPGISCFRQHLHWQLTLTVMVMSRMQVPYEHRLGYGLLKQKEQCKGPLTQYLTLPGKNTLEKTASLGGKRHAEDGQSRLLELVRKKARMLSNVGECPSLTILWCYEASDAEA